jgi:glycosyltransferase involved in cell wall biosynthesis
MMDHIGEPIDKILVDARALQDERFRNRGIGQHAASLLAGMRIFHWNSHKPELIALIDRSLPPLEDAYSALFDSVTAPSGTGFKAARVWLLNPSPMTHDPIWLARYLLDPAVYKIALFHDLIPLDMPDQYLRDFRTRASFLICTAWLHKYNALAANSHHSAAALVEKIKISADKVYTTGIAVRPSLEPGEEPPVTRRDRSHILVAGGGDPRKNPEVVLLAHARSDVLRRRDVYITGNLHEYYRNKLRKFYSDVGGACGKLHFSEHLDDSALSQLYKNALCTVVPSVAEGFSIPIIESSAAGTPVIVSDCAAHPELVKAQEYRFAPQDWSTLQAVLTRLSEVPEDWDRAADAIQNLWKSYTIELVSERFIEGAYARLPRPRAPAVVSKLRPKLAVLTPMPPAASGVADFSARTMAALTHFADVHILSPSQGAAQIASPFRSISPISERRILTGKFDKTISVLGNSHHHLEIFNFLMQYGGAAIAHDARMINFYVVLLGMDRAVRVASKELGRGVSQSEIEHWVQNQQDLTALFLSEIADAADPLIVHSPPTAERIRTLYGVEPVSLPFAVYNKLPAEELSPANRERVRTKLGFISSDILICTFGWVTADKGWSALLWAITVLRDWGLRCKLVFCGSVSPDVTSPLQNMIKELDLTEQVRILEGFVTKETYDAYLIAADAGIQLRAYSLGGLSGALNDCIGAALPTVANSHLALAMRAPDFIRTVPDDLSAILIAEAIMEILASGDNLQRPVESARAVANARSPLRYAQMLVEALGYQVGEPTRPQ